MDVPFFFFFFTWSGMDLDPTFRGALIEKMTPIWGVLKLVKKSHLFQGHVGPLFRCPKSNFSQKWASYKKLTSFAWESDTHKWSIFKVIRGVRESMDTRNLIDGCHDILRIIPEKKVL